VIAPLISTATRQQLANQPYRSQKKFITLHLGEVGGIPMRAANPWITYRTRFLVKAKQLATSLSFIDVHGRQQSGQKGDYLVESSDGVLTIASRRIFEDVYVPLIEQQNLGREKQISEVEDCALSIPLHIARKSPQPYRENGPPSAGLGSV
jgi:hypothetical protein